MSRGPCSRQRGGRVTRFIEAGKREAADRFARSKPEPKMRWIFPPNNFNTGELRFGDNDAALARQLVIDANAELLPLWDFARRCDDHGLNTPMGSVTDLEVHTHWLHVPSVPLIADEIFWYSDIPSGLALAQHHGLPTRLLDWTINPLAAPHKRVTDAGSHTAAHSCRGYPRWEPYAGGAR
jgi:hypothetical protein